MGRPKKANGNVSAETGNVSAENVTQSPLLALPHEILVHCSSFLSKPGQLMARLACRALMEAHASFVDRVFIMPQSFLQAAPVTRTRARKVPRFPPPHVFEPPPATQLPKCFPSVQVAEVVIQSDEVLESLDMGRVRDALAALHHLAKLREVLLFIELPNSKHSAAACTACISALASADLPQLRSLRLTTVSTCSAPMLESLLRAHSQLTRLEILTSGGTSSHPDYTSLCTPWSISFVPASLPNLTHLALDLDANSWSNISSHAKGRAGLQALSALTALTHLSVHNVAVLDETSGGLGGDLAVAVATMKNLKELDLPDAMTPPVIPPATLSQLQALTIAGFSLPSNGEQTYVTLNALTRLDTQAFSCLLNGDPPSGNRHLAEVLHPALQSLSVGELSLSQLPMVALSQHMTQLVVTYMQSPMRLGMPVVPSAQAMSEIAALASASTSNGSVAPPSDTAPPTTAGQEGGRSWLGQAGAIAFGSAAAPAQKQQQQQGPEQEQGQGQPGVGTGLHAAGAAAVLGVLAPLILGEPTPLTAANLPERVVAEAVAAYGLPDHVAQAVRQRVLQMLPWVTSRLETIGQVNVPALGMGIQADVIFYRRCALAHSVIAGAVKGALEYALPTEALDAGQSAVASVRAAAAYVHAFREALKLSRRMAKLLDRSRGSYGMEFLSNMEGQRSKFLKRSARDRAMQAAKDSWADVWQQVDKHKALSALAGAYRTAEAAAALVLRPGQKLGPDLHIQSLLAQAAQRLQRTVERGPGAAGAGPQPERRGGGGGAPPGAAEAETAGGEGKEEEQEGPPRKRQCRGTGRGKTSSSSHGPKQPAAPVAGTSAQPPQQPAQPIQGPQLPGRPNFLVRSSLAAAGLPIPESPTLDLFPDTASIDGLAAGPHQRLAEDAQSKLEPLPAAQPQQIAGSHATSQASQGSGEGGGAPPAEASGSGGPTEEPESGPDPAALAAVKRASADVPVRHTFARQMEQVAQQAAQLATQQPSGGPFYEPPIQSLLMGGQDAWVRQDLVTSLALVRGMKHFTLKIASDEVMEARNDGLAQGLAFTLASWAPSLRSLSLGVDLLHHILPRHLLEVQPFREVLVKAVCGTYSWLPTLQSLAHLEIFMPLLPLSLLPPGLTSLMLLGTEAVVDDVGAGDVAAAAAPDGSGPSSGAAAPGNTPLPGSASQAGPSNAGGSRTAGPSGTTASGHRLPAIQALRLLSVKPPDQYGDTPESMHAHFHMEDYVDVCLHGSKIHLQGNPLASLTPAHFLLVPSLPLGPTDVSDLLATGVCDIQKSIGAGSCSAVQADAGQGTHTGSAAGPSSSTGGGTRKRGGSETAGTSEGVQGTAAQDAGSPAAGRGGKGKRRGVTAPAQDGTAAAKPDAGPVSRGRGSRQQSTEPAEGGSEAPEQPAAGSGRSKRRAASRQRPTAGGSGGAAAATRATDTEKHHQAAAGSAAAGREGATEGTESLQGPGHRPTVYVVPNRNSHGRSPLACLLPVLRNSLTSLEITYRVVPLPHDPRGYDMPTMLQLTALTALRVWALGDPATGGRMDCRALTPLSQLRSLDRLAFMDPLLADEQLSPELAAGIVHVTALTALSRLTELDFGAYWLPHDNCRLLLHSLLPEQRLGALAWLQESHDSQKGGRQSAPGAGLVPAFDIGELDVGVMGEEDDDDTSSDDMGSDGSDMDDE